MKSNLIIFYVFSAVILLFSILSVTSRRILRAAIFLLFVLVATAGIYFWLDYEFLAGVQLALYAGGIIVLIIFSILLTHHISHKFDLPPLMNVLLGLLLSGLGSILVIWTILNFNFNAVVPVTVNTDMHEIGKQLIDTGKNGYALPFEVISILMLAALVASILIARKGK